MTLISAGWTIASDSKSYGDLLGPLEQGVGTANFLAGNDSLYGSFTADTGLWIHSGGVVNANTGADTISVHSVDGYGLHLEGDDTLGGATVLLGSGSDVVLASSVTSIGLMADGSPNGRAFIDAGAGNDAIEGSSFEDEGVYLDHATVDLGSGNDHLLGESVYGNGLYAEEDVTITGGAGNDAVVGISDLGELGLYLGEDSLIDLGAGVDELYGDGTNYGLIGEYSSTIKAGAGNDDIEGYAFNGEGFISEEEYGRGISVRNDSRFDAEAGNDCVDGYATVYSFGDRCLADAVGIEVTEGSSLALGAGDDGLTGDGYADTEFYGDSVAATTNATGVEVSFGSTLLGGAGNDVITARGEALGEDATAIGLFVGDEEYGTGTGSFLRLEAGNDQIVASAKATNQVADGDGTAEATGVLVQYQSSIDLGAGNDSIRSDATATNESASAAATATGVYIGEDSSIKGDSGRNSVLGNATATSDTAVFAYGIQVGDTSSLDNDSKIELGGGNDTVIGTATVVTDAGVGEAVGLWVNGAEINTGSGNDLVRGVSKDGEEDFVLSVGIFNAIDDSGDNNDFGKIVLGAGNDTLTGSGEDIGIWNDGRVETGDGNDLVDASTGGFYTEQATSTFILGIGNDVVKGFGFGDFDGDDGTDTIRLFGDAGGVVYNWNGTVLKDVATDGATTYMELTDFEKYGAYTGATKDLVVGNFTVFAASV